MGTLRRCCSACTGSGSCRGPCRTTTATTAATRTPTWSGRVVVEGVEDEQGCPDCGVLSGAVHSRKVRPIKDLPHGRRPLQLWWDQRRWACRERACRRRTFAETRADRGGPAVDVAAA